MSSSSSDKDTATRPMQLPKVGWDDDDADGVGVAGGDDTNDNTIELGNISSSMTRTKSDEGRTRPRQATRVGFFVPRTRNDFFDCKTERSAIL